MHRRLGSVITLLALLGVMTVGAATTLAAGVPAKAVNYVVGDEPDQNPNGVPTSSCSTPQKFDSQALNTPNNTLQNVHVDGCLFDAAKVRVSGPASFVLTGPGYFSSCPDPDGATGPKRTFSYDTNGDGLIDRCLETGFNPGDKEYHSRVKNYFARTPPAPLTRIIFCPDPENNGCGDTTIKSVVSIDWD